VPELTEENYGFEALFRARVNSEKAGFEMCRAVLVKHVTGKMAQAQDLGWYEPFRQGYEHACQEMLDFLLKDA
jgi:hypothetical protein